MRFVLWDSDPCKCGTTTCQTVPHAYCHLWVAMRLPYRAARVHSSHSFVHPFLTVCGPLSYCYLPKPDIPPARISPTIVIGDNLGLTFFFLLFFWFNNGHNRRSKLQPFWSIIYISTFNQLNYIMIGA